MIDISSFFCLKYLIRVLRLVKLSCSFKWTLRLRQEAYLLDVNKVLWTTSIKYCNAVKKEDIVEEDEFRVLNIRPPARGEKKKGPPTINMPEPRSTIMPVDQDWASVWPAPRTFHPAVVPFPVYQGVNKIGPAPNKYANTELMKIPNFLHLSPPAIKKHCEALKQFCTPWPEELKTDEDIEKHFPVEVIESDYCHSSPSIRDPLSRIINLRIKVEHLKLDKHAKDKFLRLVGPRYDPKTDYVTITTDSCPLKKQNYDYAQYLLTALVYESWKYENWEKEKSNDDMEEYIFNERQGLENVKTYFEYCGKEVPDIKKYGKAFEDWHNLGDKEEVIAKYKEAALELLSLPKTF